MGPREWPGKGRTSGLGNAIDVRFPLTRAARAALQTNPDSAMRSDLIFLERWEIQPEPGSAAAMRVAQIRRANPDLAAAIRAEIAALR